MAPCACTPAFVPSAPVRTALPLPSVSTLARRAAAAALAPRTCAPSAARMCASTSRSPAQISDSSDSRMQKTIEATVSSFNTIRTGRASTSILDRVLVGYYGVDTPLNQLASVSVQGSSTIVVDPYDKSAIKDIERALMESDVGITPSNDGSAIRLAVPPLTKERRVELVKQVKALAEEGRVAIRNIRRDAVDKFKKLEKEGDMGQDESKGLQAKMQKATDKYIKKIDEMLKDKEKDIMTV